MVEEGLKKMKFKALLQAIDETNAAITGGATDPAGGILERAASMEGKEGKDDGDAAAVVAADPGVAPVPPVGATGAAPGTVAAIDSKYLVDAADLTERGKLGNGAFGDILGGTYYLLLPSGLELELAVAIKKVNPEHVQDPKALADIVAENDRLAACDSPFVVKCYGTALSPDQGLNIVMELCDLGDLKGHTEPAYGVILRGSRMCPLPHAEMILITLQMLLGLNYVHSQLQQVLKGAFLDGSLEDFPTILEMWMLVCRLKQLYEGFKNGSNQQMQQLMVFLHDVLLPKVLVKTQS